MNNRFYVDYLIKYFWSENSDFDIQKYKTEVDNQLLKIWLDINNLTATLVLKKQDFENLNSQITEKNIQISKLKDFIDQKSWIDSLKDQISKLSENLNKIEEETKVLETNKWKLNDEILEIEKSIQKLENQKSDLELSLEPMFELWLQNYINQKKEQIHRILTQNEIKRETQKNKFSKEFDINSKDQYPLDDFKDMPEILETLKSTFETEKNNYIQTKLDDHKFEYSQNIIDNFTKIIKNYEDYKLSAEEWLIFEDIDYKHLDSIFKSTLHRNKSFFPYMKEIKELISHPLFKRQWQLALDDLKSYSSKISKTQDRKKFQKFSTTLNTLMFDYNIPIVTISDEIINQKSKEERDFIIKDPQKADNYSKYIIIDKEAIIKLQKIVNLFNETRPISFKWFEGNIVLLNNLLIQLANLLVEDEESLYTSLNKITKSNIDNLNKIVDDLLDIVEKNNIWRDVSQQIVMFQNIIWTIYTYFEEIYWSDNIEKIKAILDKLVWHIIEKMYIETFSQTIIDDNVQKNNLFSLYTDIGVLMRSALEDNLLLNQMKESIKFRKPLSPNENRNSRLMCLFDIEKKLTHFIICKNIYDISKNLFLDNEIEEWDRQAWAELYISSPDFKVPPIDPILISPDKFGTWSHEYMFESYDISDSSNYLAYVRFFNISDFKKYETLKKSICKNWWEWSEQEKLKNLLNMLSHKDKDLMSTTFVFQEFTPIFVHKSFEISIDWVNSDWLKYIIWDKNYEMFRTYLFYNFMEANRDHDSIITTPQDLVSPSVSKPSPDLDTIRVITINPDMPRTIAIPRNSWWTKNFEYKRETIVIQNPKCTTWPSWFNEAKKRWKKLYAYAHLINDFPTRKNSIEKIRLDTCKDYEEFLEKLEEFRSKYADSVNLVVRVETYRSEFEKYDWAKEKVVYKIAKTKNAPQNIIEWGKKKRWRPPKNKENI